MSKKSEQAQQETAFPFPLIPSWKDWAQQSAARTEAWTAEVEKMQREVTTRAKTGLDDLHKLALDSLEYANTLWTEWRALATAGLRASTETNNKAA